MSTVRPDLVRRTVGFRLPPGSLVVDVAWQPGSPLASFTDRYPTIAVTADAGPERSSGRSAGSVGKPALRAERPYLPFADASVDCVLLLDLGTDQRGNGRVIAEARRVLRPGGLAVVSGSSARGHLTDALIDLGLIPEQVNHIQFLLHPTKLVMRASDRLPLLCRAAAVMNRLDPSRLAQRRPARSSTVLVLGRKP